MPAPEVRDDHVTWRIPAEAAPGGARLEVDWVLANDAEFVRTGDLWTYDLRRPAARRLEYRLTLRDADGHGDPRLDPGNPRSICNPFGDRSVIEFADYVPPAWLDTEPAGELETLDLPPGLLGQSVPAQLWSAAGLETERPAPLLIANDGSGLASDADLLTWATWHSRVGRPLRVLLLDPAAGHRDAWYSADPDYVDDVVQIALPAIDSRVAVAGRIGLGISLGAVATLALQRRHPAALDAVVLQSGSFFTPKTDPQESGYSRFDKVCRAVRSMKANPPDRLVPAYVCCGAIEENLTNNLELAHALQQQGYDMVVNIFGDAHTMTGWRDAWSPTLDGLVDRLPSNLASDLPIDLPIEEPIEEPIGKP